MLCMMVTIKSSSESGRAPSIFARSSRLGTPDTRVGGWVGEPGESCVSREARITSLEFTRRCYTDLCSLGKYSKLRLLERLA